MANGTIAASQLEMLSLSGTGIITITPPATNTNRAITLPDAAGAIVVSGTTPSLNGITFPATQVPSADANTLDDYEEGTWTPTVSSQVPGTLTVAYTVQAGWYTKIGRQVNAGFAVSFTLTKGTASSDFVIDGFPFTASTISSDAQTGWIGFVSASFPIAPLGLLQNVGTTKVYIGLEAGGTASITSFASATAYSIRGTYAFIV